MVTPAQVNALLASLVRGVDCRRRQVAAVLVAPSGDIVGKGWNGLRRGSCRGGDCPRGLTTYAEVPAFSEYASNCAALHAEVSAITEAGERARGAALYVTCAPCPDCARAIVAAGVASVTVRPQYTDDPNLSRG